MYESAEPTNFAERVMGTNRDALLAVIEHLKNEARAGERQTLSLFRNEEAGERRRSFIVGSFIVLRLAALYAVCCTLHTPEVGSRLTMSNGV